MWFTSRYRNNYTIKVLHLLVILTLWTESDKQQALQLIVFLGPVVSPPIQNQENLAIMKIRKKTSLKSKFLDLNFLEEDNCDSPLGLGWYYVYKYCKWARWACQ